MLAGSNNTAHVYVKAAMFIIFISL